MTLWQEHLCQVCETNAGVREIEDAVDILQKDVTHEPVCLKQQAQEHGIFQENERRIPLPPPAIPPMQFVEPCETSPKLNVEAETVKLREPYISVGASEPTMPHGTSKK